MADWWPALVFGWPGIVVAIGLTAAGIIRRKWLWPLISAIIAAPFSFYLAGSPALGWLALLLAPMLVASGMLVKYGRAGAAWLCLVPFVGVCGWLAAAVITQ